MSAVRNPLFPFLLISTAFHLLLALSWYGRQARQPVMEEIRVTVLPAPVEVKPAPRERPKETPPPPKLSKGTPTRAELPLGQPAKKSSEGKQADQKPDKNVWNLAEKDSISAKPEKPRPRNSDIETLTQSGLPTLKELLPPDFWLLSETDRNREKPTRLDTRDPRQLSYMNRVEQALYVAWRDPAVAQSAIEPYAFEGKSVVRFIIGDNGELEDLSLTRTSGYALLDQEALRVVRAAAPNFGGLPRSIGKKLLIEVTFIHENGVDARRRSLSRTQ